MAQVMVKTKVMMFGTQPAEKSEKVNHLLRCIVMYSNNCVYIDSYLHMNTKAKLFYKLSRLTILSKISPGLM